jgi:DNA-binding response OmpR family regulator
MSTSHFILLIETDPTLTDSLAAQLVRMGIEPIRVGDLDEAVDVVKSKQYAVRAILVPSEIPGKAVLKAMKSMRRREPVLPCMAYGKEPDASQRKHLRRAGILLALWDGYDPGVLRFQINRLVSGENQASVRESRRAPIHEAVRVEVGGREKDGNLYSLSEGGCFIETPRASMDGARLRMRFGLEQRDFQIDGVVAFANVPGNLQRPNLPLGMGVRFENVPRVLRKSLAKFIRERINSLEV